MTRPRHTADRHTAGRVPTLPDDPWQNSVFEEAIERGRRERRRHEEIFNRFRSRWDEAAEAAAKGDDFPYRQLADALRRLMRS